MQRSAQGKQAIYVVGTADTKSAELHYLADTIEAACGAVIRVDISTRPSTDHRVDVSAAEVASYHPEGAAAVLSGHDRGTAVTAMSLAFTGFLSARETVDGVIGIGGGGGTSIVCAGMRALPLGIPKLMVSTLASGDVAPYVDVSDIMMMPSITDLAGLNGLSRRLLHNAAQAMVGMVNRPAPAGSEQPAIGLTMFGVTTDCVTDIVARLDRRLDCMVFHATGSGGRSMEKLVDSGLLQAVIDITTTEVGDFLFDGVLPATEDRFGAVARTGIPYIGSVGALDMVNFWAPDTVPERYRKRTLYKHNPNVTLMRTSVAECRAIGRWIATRLNACNGPVHFLIPERGISALDAEGGAFFDPQADAALFDSIEEHLHITDTRQLQRLPLHINDPAFAAAVVSQFHDLTHQAYA